MLLLDMIGGAWQAARNPKAFEEPSDLPQFIHKREIVLWIDPVNCDANFLNCLALALHNAGRHVIVRADIRKNFEPPAELEFSSFSGFGRLPQSLERNKALKGVLAAIYPLNWKRAIHFASKHGVRSVLVSSSLVLPRYDISGLKLLREHDILPLVIAHKPYPGFYGDENKRAERYREYYELAERILVMTRYSQRLLQELYGFPDEKFVLFPHPHFRNLLEPTEPLSV